MTQVSAAIVLCAGRGARLKPYTNTIPKPLLPMNGRPTLSYILESLKLSGIERVCLVTHYLSEQIERYATEQAFFPQGAICCAKQPGLAGTADATLCALEACPDWFDGPFLLSASDYIVPRDFYPTLTQAYQREARSIVVSIKRLPDEELAMRSSVRFNDQGDVLEIVEKPLPGTAPSRFSANLVYILPANIVPMIAAVEPSPRGEKEVQTAINVHLETNGVAFAVEQPAPVEWQPPAE